MSLDQRVVGLLEDDPIMSESLVQRLALEGTVVRWWRSGREAITEIEREKPEAIVCDIRLPDISGEDVFRAIAGHDAAPPFLFITGYGDIDQAPASVVASDQGRPVVEKLGRGGSARLRPLVPADGFAEIPATDGDLPGGAPIAFHPFHAAFAPCPQMS